MARLLTRPFVGVVARLLTRPFVGVVVRLLTRSGAGLLPRVTVRLGSVGVPETLRVRGVEVARAGMALPRRVGVELAKLLLEPVNGDIVVTTERIDKFKIKLYKHQLYKKRDKFVHAYIKERPKYIYR